METLTQEGSTMALALAGVQEIPTNEECQVTAFTPVEMVNANATLIAWFEKKVVAQDAEAAELEQAAAHAIERKWKSATLKKHASLSRKRVQFFGKILAALKAGYYIVPNFPITAFAIRTKEGAELKSFKTHVGSWRPGWIHEQAAKALPQSEGEYKNPFPHVEEYVDHHDKDNKPVWYSQALAWDAFEFPLNMAKPQIMEATSRAMALQIFDSLGVLPGKSRKDDPMIIGRVCDPRTDKYSFRGVSFIIGWHFDTRVL